MFVLIEGEIRRKECTGFGPFKKVRWQTEPFNLRFAQHGEKAELEDCVIERLDQKDRVFLNATIHGIPCYIADFDTSAEPKAVDFNLLSIAGVEFRGKAMMVGAVAKPPVPAYDQQRYIA